MLLLFSLYRVWRVFSFEFGIGFGPRIVVTLVGCERGRKREGETEIEREGGERVGRRGRGGEGTEDGITSRGHEGAG